MRKEQLDHAANAARIAGMVAAGVSMKAMCREFGWTRYQAREAVRHVGLTCQTDEPEATPPPAKDSKKKRKEPPSPEEIKARAASDEITVPWSNWLDDPEQYGGWVREAGEPQEIFETDDEGNDAFVGLRVDPGILWPVDWTGPKTVTEIPKPRVRPRPAAYRGYFMMQQNMTPLHGPAYINIMARARSQGAEVVVVGQTYGKGLFESRKKKGALEVAPWPREIAYLVTRKRRTLPGGVELAAEMPISPTTSRPLNGKHRYARGKRMIFAHPKREIRTVPRPKGKPSVLLWTTGAISVPNYVLRQAGVMAVQDHQIGAVLVEVDFEGRVFVREINCHPRTGAFYELDVYVENGLVRRAANVHAERGMYGPVIAWGDIHRNQLNTGCARIAWGYGGMPPNGDKPMIDVLRASWQVKNDLSNFTAGSHHHEHDPYMKVEKVALGTDDVEAELRQAADFLVETSRPWCRTIITYSNHDAHFDRWLSETDWRKDPANAEFYLESALRKVRARKGKEQSFNAFENAMRTLRPDADFDFVTADNSDCEIYGVSFNYHGDQNPNGARGSTSGLAQMGLSVVKFHDHQVTVFDRTRSGGCMQGIEGDEPGADYTHGASSWVFAAVVVHPDGNCQTIPFDGGCWRA